MKQNSIFEKQVEKIKQDKNLSTKKFSDDIDRVKELHILKEQDKWNNLFHLSSYSGLINDPNGLVKHNSKYHIFYQWSPFTPIHSMKHWGHFETKNYIDYVHTGLAIEPSFSEDKDGAFSGGGISYQNKMYIFWTGNIKPWGTKDINRSSFTMVGEWDDKLNKVINKKSLFEVDKSKYTGHFRDPKPLLINNKFYLLHGAQTKNMEGTLSIYKSNFIDKDYKLLGNIEIIPKIEKFGFMWECPDYINIDGTDFLIFSPQGKSFYQDKNENRDTVICLPGKLDLENLKFHHSGKPQILDEGFDFYAPQIFSNTKRKILIGWAGIGNSESYATFKNMWAHNLTLSREIKIGKNNKLLQTPLIEYEKLRRTQIKPSKIIDLSKSRLIEFIVNFNNDFKFKLENLKGESISFEFKDNLFFSSRENMSVDQGVNFGQKRNRKHYNNFSKARVYIDNSLIEIYANDGEFIFTSKYFLTGDIKVKTSSFKKMDAYQLKPFRIEWNV